MSFRLDFRKNVFEIQRQTCASKRYFFQIHVHGRRSTFRNTIATKHEINARYNDLFYPNRNELNTIKIMTEEIERL